MKKIISFISAVCLSGSLAFSETISRTEDYNSFSGISACDNFDVTVHSGLKYSAEINIDTRVSDYCEVFVQGDILTMRLNEKKFPKELKSLLRQKNSIPLSLSVNVTIPITGNLSSINLEDNAKLKFTSKIKTSGKFVLNVTDNASISGLDITANQAELILQKKSIVQGEISTSKRADITINNSASAELNISGNNTTVKTNNSSNVNLKCTGSDIVLNAEERSLLTAAGNVNKLEVKGKGNSKINAHSLTSENISVNVSGSECIVNATKNLLINLSNGAKLVYDGQPVINIESILNSSVTRYDPKSQK